MGSLAFGQCTFILFDKVLQSRRLLEVGNTCSNYRSQQSILLKTRIRNEIPHKVDFQGVS